MTNRKFAWLAIPSAVASAAALLTGLMITAQPTKAQPDFTRRERVACVVCHQDSWTSGKYTKAGEYYHEHHTLKGYKPEAAAGKDQSQKPK